jgi:prepilin-type processing-associated H-X9-DG protein
MMVVLTTIVLLAALLMPVFVTAKESSKRVVCASNFHQVSTATNLYLNDYDDRLLPVNYVVKADSSGSQDSTWVQLTLPYIREFGIFECPSDYTRIHNQRAFEPTAVAGDPYSRFYEASKRSNIGYNWLYLAPVVARNGRWLASPRYVNQVSDPSNTVLMADSVYDVVGNSPRGGGYYLIYPPCRYTTSRSDSFRAGSDENEIWTPELGWEDKAGGDIGHVWPWHNQQANVLRVDGSLKPFTIKKLEAGCDAKSRWDGSIFDDGAYMWDLR